MIPIQTFWVNLLPKLSWTVDCHEKGPCSIHGDFHRGSSEAVVLQKNENFDYKNKKAPTHCSCGYQFKTNDVCASGRPFYRRLDTHTEISKLTPGALYIDDEVYPDSDGWSNLGSDGLSVVCVLPNNMHWHIDHRCSNCSLPNDLAHRCWVRHGTFNQTLHVDKQGITCSAGAGSIDVKSWHGFLHNGYLKL